MFGLSDQISYSKHSQDTFDDILKLIAETYPNAIPKVPALARSIETKGSLDKRVRLVYRIK